VWVALVPDDGDESSPQSIVVLVMELCESVQLLVAVTIKEFVPLCTVGCLQVGGATTWFATTMLSGCVAVPAFASLTCTVKLEVPAVVGVPVIAPAVLRLNPAGRAPTVVDQVYGVVPPVAVSVWL
jgi:hypothetical protein